MAEIDRVEDAIRVFFEEFGPKQIEAFQKVVETFVINTTCRAANSSSRDKDKNKPVQDILDSVGTELETLAKNSSGTNRELTESYSGVVGKIMVAWRMVYPLENRDAPWSPPTAEQALRNDDDIHSIVIFDSIVEKIEEAALALRSLPQ